MTILRNDICLFLSLHNMILASIIFLQTMGGDYLTVSKAQQKAQNKWISKTYDRINLTVAKGKKDHSDPRGSPQRERKRLYQPSHRRSHRARRKRSCGVWGARRGIIEERRAISPLLLHILRNVLKVGFEIRSFRCIEGLIWNETLATVQIRRSLRRFEIRAVKLASIWDWGDNYLRVFCDLLITYVQLMRVLLI